MAKKDSCPWDRLPAKDVGDKSDVQIYLRVGVALSSFERLQLMTGMLLREVIGFDSRYHGRPSMAVDRAFGTLINIEPRIKMIQSAAEIAFMFRPETLAKTKGLMTQYSALSQRRNEIAHGIVTHFNINGRDCGFFLAANTATTDRNKSFITPNGSPFGDYAYTADQVEHYEKEFDRLSKEVWQFTHEIQADPPHEYVYPTKRPPA